MRVEQASGRVLEGPLEPVYVYEAPVRLWHWVMMLCMIVLAGTGYLIGSPLPAVGGEAAVGAARPLAVRGPRLGFSAVAAVFAGAVDGYPVWYLRHDCGRWSAHGLVGETR